MPRAAAGRRGRQRARVHQWPLRPGLSRSRRHPCAAGRGGQAPGAGRVSDDLGGWGGAECVLAADRLDMPDVIEAADPGDMLRQVAAAAAQVRTALRSCAETDLSAFAAEGRPRAIVVAGVGASALAGEMLNALAGLSTPVPVVVSPAERLPRWVGATAAVISVSSSVASASSLALAGDAVRRGCPTAS